MEKKEAAASLHIEQQYRERNIQFQLRVQSQLCSPFFNILVPKICYLCLPSNEHQQGMDQLKHQRMDRQALLTEMVSMHNVYKQLTTPKAKLQVMEMEPLIPV